MYSRRFPLIVLLAIFGFESSAALAGSCEFSSRSGTVGTASKPKAETVVKNQMTSENVKVEISRGDSSTAKFSRFLEPGEEGSFTASISKNGGTAEMRIQLYAETSRIAPECKYIVSNTADEKLVWKLPDGVTDVCPNLNKETIPFTVTCDKSFNSDKMRYRTHLTLTDR